MVSKQSESGGVANTDVKIENFDIAFGSHILLSSAELSLNYGRRYGLVGRNGKDRQCTMHVIGNGRQSNNRNGIDLCRCWKEYPPSLHSES